MKDKEEARKAYNKLAEDYHKKRVTENDFNKVIEQPTTFNLVGNVKGKKVLDAGCGSGIYTKILTKKGAKVSALELSDEMIRLAKEYCKDYKIDFKQGSIDKLPYKNKIFDIIVASLVIHYLKYPEKAFREFRRVLKDNGFLIFSTHHFAFDSIEKIERKKGRVFVTISDYLKEGKFYWNIHNSKVKIPSYRKRLERLFDILYKTGFIVEKFVEPYITKKQFRQLSLDKRRMKYLEIPAFIVLKCRKVKK